MNHQEFKQVVLDQHEQSLNTLAAKADEYSKDDDRFWNFNRAAQILGTTPEKALLGMFVKHFVSITDIVELAGKGQAIPMNVINEKWGDAVNYLLLLKGMLIGRINLTTTKGE